MNLDLFTEEIKLVRLDFMDRFLVVLERFLDLILLLVYKSSQDLYLPGEICPLVVQCLLDFITLLLEYIMQLFKMANLPFSSTVNLPNLFLYLFFEPLDNPLLFLDLIITLIQLQNDLLNHQINIVIPPKKSPNPRNSLNPLEDILFLSLLLRHLLHPLFVQFLLDPLELHHFLRLQPLFDRVGQFLLHVLVFEAFHY